MSELRDVVLETLSQIGIKKDQDIIQDSFIQDRSALSASLIDEREFLSLQREKFVLLFEGLLSVDVQNVEEKLELVLRFLQFQISEIDRRLSEIN